MFHPRDSLSSPTLIANVHEIFNFHIQCTPVAAGTLKAIKCVYIVTPEIVLCQQLLMQILCQFGGWMYEHIRTLIFSF